MKWIPCGPRAILFQFAERLGDEAFHFGQAISADIESKPPSGLVEYVPAFTTVLLEFDPKIVPDPSRVAPELEARFESALRAKLPTRAVKEIPVCYDGGDLPSLAKAKNLTTAEVCDLHSAPVYKVYALGFTPGFPYLGDLDSRLHVPRLASPRVKVRAGAVAIGGEHTGIYTVESPAGWNIIGHTPLKIFDPERGASNGADTEMFFLKPGDRVKFVPQK